MPGTHRPAGILCASLDIAEGHQANFLEWHNREHLVERLGVPGFVSGRRFVSPEASPRYFIAYEVADLSVLASPEYLERLDQPTPWTLKTVATFRNGFRSAYAVVRTAGWIEGGFVLAVRFKPRDPTTTLAGITDDRLDALLQCPGITRLRVAIPDEQVSTTDTVEARESGNVFANDLLLLVEGISAQALSTLLGDALSGEQFFKGGLQERPWTGIYQLQARAGR